MHLNYAGLMLNGSLLKLSGFKRTCCHSFSRDLATKCVCKVFYASLTRSSDHVIAIADPVKQAHIANGFPPEKISIIHNPSISSYTLTTVINGTRAFAGSVILARLEI